MRAGSGYKIASLSASAFVMVTANTMLFPIFPHMRRALDLDLRDISLLVLAVALPAAILSPIAGYLADLWGRKNVMIPSIVLYGLGGAFTGVFVLVLEHPFVPMVFSRVLQGIGSAAPLYLAVVLAGDIFQDEEARSGAMGVIETANGLGKVLSPIIGGVLGLLMWWAPFFFYPAVSLPVAIGLWLTIDEPPIEGPEESPAEAVAAFRELLNRSHVIALCAGLLSILCLYGVMFWIGEHFEEVLGGGTLVQGLIISVPVAALIATALVTHRLLDHLGFQVVLAGGLVLAGGAVGLLPLVAESPMLWPTIVGVGVGAGVLLPTVDTVATAAAARGHRGIVTTTFGSFRCFGAAAAPYLVGALISEGLAITFLPIAVLTVFLGLATLAFAREQELLPEGTGTSG